jgi:hypothetical protein
MTETPKIPDALPDESHDIARKPASYGFRIESSGVWVLHYAPGDKYGRQVTTLPAFRLGEALLHVLREEEEARGVLFRYEQFDACWAKIVYGIHKNDTTIAAAGCGPTSLAIVLQYVINNGSHPVASSSVVTPAEAAKWAARHGRVSGHGTDGDKMIRDLHQQWAAYDGSRVSLSAATALLQEGHLIIFLSHGVHGWSRKRPLHRTPDVLYLHHFMVLAGVEGPDGPHQVFYVVDPGRNIDRAMRYTVRSELQYHAAGFWWVYRTADLDSRSSGS